MLKSLKLLLLSGLVTASLPGYSANQNLENSVQYLTGDTRLACEAILCLSSAYRPSECSPSLNRYFSIDDKKARKKIRKRKNFLNKCPAGDTANANLWVSLIDSISESAKLSKHLRRNLSALYAAMLTVSSFIFLSPFNKKTFLNVCEKGLSLFHYSKYEYIHATFLTLLMPRPRRE